MQRAQRNQRTYYAVLVGILILGMLWFSTWEIKQSIESTKENDPLKFPHVNRKDIEQKNLDLFDGESIPKIPIEEVQLKKKVILSWNSIWVDHWEDRLTNFDGCKFRNCEVTTDQKRLDESDAVIIYIPHNWDSTVKPPTRTINQIWIMFSIESPFITYYTVPFINMNFNWTMTYRRDADISYLYQKDIPYSLGDPSKKHGKTMWMAYHCEAKNRRIDYIAELMNYTQIDSYGICLHNKDSLDFVDENGVQQSLKPTGRMQYMSDSNWDMYRTYKFYLAFENVNCHDYVTEKFWRPLLYGSVPIVMGAPNIDDYAPAPHSIIKVSDFSSPKELAAYIDKVDKDDALYNKYLEWRHLPFEKLNKKYQDMIKQRTACQLCEKMNQPLTYTSYNDLESWSVESQCKYIPQNKPTVMSQIS